METKNQKYGICSDVISNLLESKEITHFIYSAINGEGYLTSYTSDDNFMFKELKTMDIEDIKNQTTFLYQIVSSVTNGVNISFNKTQTAKIIIDLDDNDEIEPIWEEETFNPFQSLKKTYLFIYTQPNFKTNSYHFMISKIKKAEDFNINITPIEENIKKNTNF